MAEEPEFCARENGTFPSKEFEDSPSGARIHAKEGARHFKDTGEPVPPRKEATGEDRKADS